MGLVMLAARAWMSGALPAPGWTLPPLLAQQRMAPPGGPRLRQLYWAHLVHPLRATPTPPVTEPAALRIPRPFRWAEPGAERARAEELLTAPPARQPIPILVPLLVPPLAAERCRVVALSVPPFPVRPAWRMILRPRQLEVRLDVEASTGRERPRRVPQLRRPEDLPARAAPIPERHQGACPGGAP